MLDSTDAKIIKFLQQDGRTAYSYIARELGITEPTVRARVQKLLQEKVIQIIAIGDPIKLGFKKTGNMKVQIEYKKIDHIIEELKKIDQVWYVGLLTGANHLELEFIAKSMEDLKELTFRINNIDGIHKTESFLLMEVIKENYIWGSAVDQ